MIQRAQGNEGSIVDIAQVRPPDAVGEMGVSSSQRSASVVCQTSRLLAVEYTQKQFENMLKNLPYFSCSVPYPGRSSSDATGLPAKYEGDLSELDASVCGLAICLSAAPPGRSS